MSASESAEAIAAEGRVYRLGVLDKYGVRWAPLSIARDVLQNFFDASPDLSGVRVVVDRAERSVTVEGPASFDVELLAYVGATTKNDGRSAGGFGEGFKVAALVLARDHGAAVSAGSADWSLSVFFDDVSLGRELCFRVSPVSPARSGSWVRIEAVPDEVLTAFEGARDLFRHPSNPKFATPVAVSDDGAAGVFRAPRGLRSEVYYRRQFRGSFHSYHGPALVLVCDDVVDALEGDRDRTDLAPAPVARAIAQRLSPEAIRAYLDAVEGTWGTSDSVLIEVLRVASERKLTFTFPPRWLARDRDAAAVERFATRQGFRLAIGWFREVGMRTASQYYKGDLQTFAPTPEQRARIAVMARLYADLLGAKDPPEKTFEVFDDPRAAVLGQHLGKTVIVDAKLLRRGRFVDAAGTVLHELAHETGGEDSDTFKRRLVTLGAAVLANADAVKRARSAWRRVDRTPVFEAPAEAPAEEAPAVEAPTEAPPKEVKPTRDPEGVFVYFASPRIEALTAEFEARLTRAVEATGRRVRMVSWFLDERTDAIGALPVIYFEGRELAELVGVEHAPKGSSWTARDFGGDVLPSVDLLAGALLAAELPEVRYPFRDRTPSALKKTRSVEASMPPRARLDKALDDLCTWGASELDDVWGCALNRARRCIAARVEVVSDDIKAEVQRIEEEEMRGIVYSRELRAQEKDFDEGDPLDEKMMGCAQGAAVLAWVQAPGGDPERARRDFHAVRALLAKAWELEIFPRYREAMLLDVMRETPLSEGRRAVDPPTPIDLDDLSAAWERARARSLAWQRHADDEGRHAIESFEGRYGPSPWEQRVSRSREEREAAARARAQERIARLRRALDVAWRDAHARGGPIEAMRAALALVARRRAR